MAWQRKTPFGYLIQKGRTAQHPAEAEAVKDIFQLYLTGLSYQQIAREMERRGIHYHQHTPQWNKHMVKRILENRNYLGTEVYPAIISGDDFLAVHLQKTDKTDYAPCPEKIAPVRKKAVCAHCGAVMTRDTKTHGKTRWRCQNGECGQTVTMEDWELLARLGERLRELADRPDLLTPAKLPAQDGPSLDAVRIQNELNLAFNRGAESGEMIRLLIFAAAAETYSAIPDPGPAYRMDSLRARLAAAPEDETLQQELLDTAVKAIRIGKSSLELELVNGANIQTEEEKTA